MDSPNVSSEADDCIKMLIRGPDGVSLHEVRLSKSTQLMRVLAEYCAHLGLTTAGLQFLLDGKRIGDMDTPESTAMRDGETVMVLAYQEGG